MRNRNVTAFTRDRRRPPGRPAGRWRLADPRTYLTGVMVLAACLLVVLPYGADGVNAVLGPRGTDGCRVLRVVDGDTVTLWCPGSAPYRARLTGYDAPEVFSPGCAAELAAGMAATWALRGHLFRAQTITVTPRGKDRFDRALVALSLDGRPLAPVMITAGHGRPYAGGPRPDWCA
ncbi:MAG TPA: hypothetical protein PKD10_16285 [Paracoccaceae bacterium]|nr:hypothetical protein [Paracoccaceae bacterium]HMO73062.1 hypothetical protein [Paracoccaceae bacterium]